MIDSGRTQSRSKTLIFIVWNFLAFFGLVTLLLNGAEYSEFRILSKGNKIINNNNSNKPTPTGLNTSNKNLPKSKAIVQSFENSRQQKIDDLNDRMQKYDTCAEQCEITTFAGRSRKKTSELEVKKIGNEINAATACSISFAYGQKLPFESTGDKKTRMDMLEGHEDSCEHQFGVWKKRLDDIVGDCDDFLKKQYADNPIKEYQSDSIRSNTATTPSTTDSNNKQNNDPACVELMDKCDIVWSVQVRKEKVSKTNN